jgi:hypothetical protein
MKLRRLLQDYTVTRMCVTVDGVLDWILDLLITYTHDSELQVIIAPSPISTILQITTAQANSFRACCVLTSLSLVTDSNSGDYSTSAFQSSLMRNFLPTEPFFFTDSRKKLTLLPRCLSYNFSAGWLRQHR